MSKVTDDNVIRFQAQVFKVSTLIDGGLRLTLDLIVPTGDNILALIDAKKPGIILDMASVVIIPEKQEKTETNGALSTRAKRKSEWAPAEITSPNSNT